MAKSQTISVDADFVNLLHVALVGGSEEEHVRARATLTALEDATGSTTTEDTYTA